MGLTYFDTVTFLLHLLTRLHLLYLVVSFGLFDNVCFRFAKLLGGFLVTLKGSWILKILKAIDQSTK